VSHRVIVVRIFLTVPDSPAARRDTLVGFYDDSYARKGEQALLYSRWRALGAKGKADHVVELCSGGGVRPTRTLEVGCASCAIAASAASCTAWRSHRRL
jgi:hypothetical protein